MSGVCWTEKTRWRGTVVVVVVWKYGRQHNSMENAWLFSPFMRVHRRLIGIHKQYLFEYLLLFEIGIATNMCIEQTQ